MDHNTVPCKGCGSCTLNCPTGLDIPFLMKAYNQYKKSGTLPEGLYSSIDKNPRLCVQCAHCTQLCPQSIDIPGTIRFLGVL